MILLKRFDSYLSYRLIFSDSYDNPAGQQSLIKVTGGQMQRLLARPVQLLKLLPRLDKKSHFYVSGWTYDLIFKSLERTQKLILMALEQIMIKL